MLLESIGNHRIRIKEKRAQSISYTRNHSKRKTVLDVDLNISPLFDNRYQEGNLIPIVPGNVSPVQKGAFSTPVPIDVEELDNDVITISSPRALTEVCFTI